MAFGIIGIAFMLGPIAKESISCDRIEPIKIIVNKTINETTTPRPRSTESKSFVALYDICKTPQELLLSLLYVTLAPMLWGIVAGDTNNSLFTACETSCEIPSLIYM